MYFLANKGKRSLKERLNQLIKSSQEFKFLVWNKKTLLLQRKTNKVWMIFKQFKWAV